jgi:anaerobic selenocysteine-containing dehydrogenase
MATETLASACPLDCPDACSLAVTVEEGRLSKIDGSRANPVTGGFICAKVRRFPEHVYGRDRLLRPARRTGQKGDGRFEPCSWDEALGLVAAKLLGVRAEQGGEAILPFSYGGSNGYLSQDTTDARLFYRLGASRLARTVCAAPTGAAAAGLYGKMPGVAYADYVHARLIVIWGANPSASGIHLVPYVQEAQRRGARLVVLDPRRTPLARRADLHLPVRPGTDLPVALSLVRWLVDEGHAADGFLADHATGFSELRRRAEPWTLEHAAEVAGVESAAIERLARLYAETSPAVIRCGWGLERNRNGGSAVAAILALPAVAGKFGVRGGGYTLSNSGAWTLSASPAVREPEPTTRVVNMNRLGESLISGKPPVGLLFVYNCNPLATMPRQDLVRQGLLREDLFTVVFEQVMTDTARYADVLLPATTFLERTEMSRGYGAYALQRPSAVIAPVGEARSNHEVFADLCRRTGLAREGEPESAEDLSTAILGGQAQGGAIEAALHRDGVAFPESGAAPVQFGDVFPRTDDGKIHLLPKELDREAPGGLYGYWPDPATDLHPLALVSPASDKRISSTLGQLHRGRVPVELGPRDAERRGIRDGDRVRIRSEFGEVVCPARVTPDVRDGVVVLPKGLWAMNTENGATANALCPDTLTDVAGGACFNDARVEIERLAPDAR